MIKRYGCFNGIELNGVNAKLHRIVKIKLRTMKVLLLMLLLGVSQPPTFHNRILILHPTPTTFNAYVQNTDTQHGYNVTVKTVAVYGGQARESQQVVQTPAGGKSLIPIVDDIRCTFTFTVLGEAIAQ